MAAKKSKPVYPEITICLTCKHSKTVHTGRVSYPIACNDSLCYCLSYSPTYQVPQAIADTPITPKNVTQMVEFFQNQMVAKTQTRELETPLRYSYYASCKMCNKTRLSMDLTNKSTQTRERHCLTCLKKTGVTFHHTDFSYTNIYHNQHNTIHLYRQFLVEANFLARNKKRRKQGLYVYV